MLPANFYFIISIIYVIILIMELFTLPDLLLWHSNKKGLFKLPTEF